ncbi:hypothetical protein HOY80DRAFT_1136197, partial [Tuber brumale]
VLQRVENYDHSLISKTWWILLLSWARAVPPTSPDHRCQCYRSSYSGPSPSNDKRNHPSYGAVPAILNRIRRLIIKGQGVIW